MSEKVGVKKKVKATEKNSSSSANPPPTPPAAPLLQPGIVAVPVAHGLLTTAALKQQQAAVMAHGLGLWLRNWLADEDMTEEKMMHIGGEFTNGLFERAPIPPPS